MTRERYQAAQTMDAFVASARENVELWRSMYARARAPDELVERAAALPGRFRLLVLLEDWCGDAVNTVPVIARLAEAAPNLELRVLPRDANPELMDAHLTGSARAIPVVIVLDEHGRELGWWGPRPAALQAWATSPRARAMTKEDRYREIRRWYARDRRRTTLEEIVELLEGATIAAAA